jgi:hypothetical protein
MTQLGQAARACHGDPGPVSTDVTHSETVVFELSDSWGAKRLSERLRHRWHSGVTDGGEAALVTVQLRLEEGDLAALLRAVKLWVDEQALDSIRFHLDGRDYVLEAGSSIRPPA